jgi:hypothetical protein
MQRAGGPHTGAFRPRPASRPARSRLPTPARAHRLSAPRDMARSSTRSSTRTAEYVEKVSSSASPVAISWPSTCPSESGAAALGAPSLNAFSMAVTRCASWSSADAATGELVFSWSSADAATGELVFGDATARCSVASAQDAPASRVVHGGRCGRVRGGATTEGCGHANESPLRKSPFGSFEAPAVPACRRIRVAHASEQRGGIAGAAWVQRSPQRPLAGPVANGQSRGRLLAARLRHVARQEPVLALGPRGVVCDPGHQRVSARRGVSVRVLVASQAWECSETEVVDACWK